MSPSEFIQWLDKFSEKIEEWPTTREWEQIKKELAWAKKNSSVEIQIGDAVSFQGVQIGRVSNVSLENDYIDYAGGRYNTGNISAKIETK